MCEHDFKIQEMCLKKESPTPWPKKMEIKVKKKKYIKVKKFIFIHLQSVTVTFVTTWQQKWDQKKFWRKVVFFVNK